MKAKTHLYAIRGSHGIGITDLGEFVNLDTKEICTPLVSETGDIGLTIGINQYFRSKDWWLLFAKSEQPGEQLDLDNVKFYKLETPLTRKDNVWRVHWDCPVYSQAEFRIVPSYPRISVTSDGICASTETGKILNLHQDQKGYLFANVYDPVCREYRSIGVHILVAMAWLPEGPTNEFYMVNHKDGIKSNNSVSNLEWCNHKGNNFHAVWNDLNIQAESCKIRDILTGEIKQFPSIKQAMIFLGFDTNKASVLFENLRPTRLFKSRYELRLKSDKRPWYYTKVKVTEENISQIKDKCLYRVTVKNIHTGEILIFNGVNAVFEKYQLRNHACADRKLLKRLLKEKYPELSVNFIKQVDTGVVQVKNLETGEITEYPSANKVAKKLGIEKRTVLRMIKFKGAKSFKGFAIRRKINSDWPVQTPRLCEKKAVIITSKFTEESVEYPSLTQAAKALNTSKIVVKRHINSPRESDRYSVKFRD